MTVNPQSTRLLRVPGSLAVPIEEMRAFWDFLQHMANRRAVGYARYGKIKSTQRYMSRLATEVKAYRKTGNREQLLNIAVYAFLESYAPENNKFHWDSAVESVTRKKFGGA